MKWEKEALERIEQVPVPPVMARYAKLDAEMRARAKGLDQVTAEIVLETEKGYISTFGAEAVATITAMAEGKDAGLPDEFYEEDAEDLFAIHLCPAKYGACTAEKRDMMRSILNSLRAKLKALNITQIIMENPGRRSCRIMLLLSQLLAAQTAAFPRIFLILASSAPIAHE